MALPSFTVGSVAQLGSLLGTSTNPQSILVVFARRFRIAIVEAARRCGVRHGTDRWTKPNPRTGKPVTVMLSINGRDSDKVVAAKVFLNLKRDGPMFLDEMARVAFGMPMGKAGDAPVMRGR